MIEVILVYMVGAEPGSAGCIDLTHHIDEFTQWFEKNGHDLIINIKYH
jgi:hypothetical protein